jgi:ureidoglycolate lyase
MAAVEEGLEVRTVTAEQLTADRFAPFGTVLGPEGHERLPIELYGGTVDAYAIPIEADEPFQFLFNRLRYRGMRIHFLERHSHLTQAFIPIDGLPFVQVVAPADAPEEDGLPALGSVRAFVVPGGRGVQIARGVWHEPPFPLQAEQQLIVTSHTSLTLGLQQRLDERKEIGRLDVDKRNVTERAGVVLRVELP